MSKEELESVQIHYQKTFGFRNIFVTGAFGGASVSNKMIYMSLFTDRPPIPKTTESMVNGDEILGETTKIVDSKKGIIRDVEIGCILDLNTSKILVQWLQNHINTLESK